jgi:CRISPR-associated exonuclease Cas4
MTYEEDEMLMLSGIQHYMFCPRQWALIHIEQQWSENKLTTEGKLLHKNVDNPSYRQKNGNAITLRSVSIASKQLGLYGVSDAIELVPTNSEKNAIKHSLYPGSWKLLPIEYKRGHSKLNQCDEVQLTAQTICLEEMYQIHIDIAALFYGETKHREMVNITSSLREMTIQCANEMHDLYKDRYIPKATKKLGCKNCSISDICLPESIECSTVQNYLNHNLYEETT